MPTAQATMARHRGRDAKMPRESKQPDSRLYSGRLAARIRAIRQANGLSVEDVAERMRRAGYDISAPTLYGWENGNRAAPLDAMPALARALKVDDLHELLPPR